MSWLDRLDRDRQRLAIEVADRNGGADQQREAPAQHLTTPATMSDTPWRGSVNRIVARPSATSTLDGPASAASSLAFCICAYCADDGVAGEPMRCHDGVGVAVLAVDPEMLKLRLSLLQPEPLQRQRDLPQRARATSSS